MLLVGLGVSRVQIVCCMVYVSCYTWNGLSACDPTTVSVCLIHDVDCVGLHCFSIVQYLGRTVRAYTPAGNSNSVGLTQTNTLPAVTRTQV